MANACTGADVSFFPDAGPQHGRRILPTAVEVDRSAVHRAPLRNPERTVASCLRDL